VRDIESPALSATFVFIKQFKLAIEELGTAAVKGGGACTTRAAILITTLIPLRERYNGIGT